MHVRIVTRCAIPYGYRWSEVATYECCQFLSFFSAFIMQCQHSHFFSSLFA